jgi:L-ascorbate metabolism protein UlaG (beta-lactamase superfamily)
MTLLIQPVRSGASLVEEIESTRPARGTIAVWWLGQSGFLIKSRRGVLVIDPYLSESLTRKYAGTGREHVRMTAAPLRGRDLTMVDIALASHKHSDHLDPGTIVELTRASGCGLGLPTPLFDHAVSMGVLGKSIGGLEAGQTLDAGGFRIRAIPSAHEGLDTDERGRHLYLGFVIEVDGLRLYHSGDSLAYGGLEAWLGTGPFDVTFLPINGRDPSRGVPGNMSAAEAVDLAARVRPRFVVPHHYNMFTFNTVPVEQFEIEARRLPGGVLPRVLRCGERWEVGPWA